MSSLNPDRNTRFEMESLTGLEQSTSLPEPEGHVTAGQHRLQDRQALNKLWVLFDEYVTANPIYMD